MAELHHPVVTPFYVKVRAYTSHLLPLSETTVDFILNTVVLPRIQDGETALPMQAPTPAS